MATSNKFSIEEVKFTGRYAGSVYKTLLAIYHAYLFRCVVFLIFGLLGRAFILSNANLIGFWVDSFCHAPAICKSVPSWTHGFGNTQYLLTLFAVTVIGFIFTLSFRIGFSRVSALAISAFYDEVTLRTSRYPMSFFDATPAGRIITRFSSDYGNVFRLFGGPLAEYISIIFDLICMFVLVGFASPYYIPVCIGIGCLNYVVYRLNRERLRHERRELSANRSPSIAHFAETAQGASTIRTYQKQNTFSQRFVGLNNLFLQQKLKTTKIILGFSFQMSCLTALLLLATGLAGLWLTRHGLVSIGSIGVAFSFIILSGNTLQMFFEWMAQFEEAMIGVERLDNYLRKDLEPGLLLPSSAVIPTEHPVANLDREKQMDQSDRRSPFVQQQKAEVTVENLWFRYRHDLPYVLKDVTFKVAPGERLGVVGRTGSGKSSLIQALFHLYPVERGKISVAGKEAQLKLDTTVNTTPQNELDLTVYRQSIALISQDPVLFRGTVRENLSLDENVSDNAMLEALKRVDLWDWFLGQKKGLDAHIEERARNLSAGEKQLLCMARCLLQNSPLIIMDEATSAVDPQSEEILVRATNELFRGRTQIIVAHRLSTLLGCDRILWLQNGEIKMLGKTSEVLPIFERTRLTHELSDQVE